MAQDDAILDALEDFVEQRGERFRGQEPADRTARCFVVQDAVPLAELRTEPRFGRLQRRGKVAGARIGEDARELVLARTLAGGEHRDVQIRRVHRPREFLLVD